jgi:hypothetical protein
MLPDERVGPHDRQQSSRASLRRTFADAEHRERRDADKTHEEFSLDVRFMRSIRCHR